MYLEMSALLDDNNVESAFRMLVQCTCVKHVEILNKSGQWTGRTKPEPKLLKEAVLTVANSPNNGSPSNGKVHLSSKPDHVKKSFSATSNCCS